MSFDDEGLLNENKQHKYDIIIRLTSLNGVKLIRALSWKQLKIFKRAQC